MRDCYALRDHPDHYGRLPTVAEEFIQVSRKTSEAAISRNWIGVDLRHRSTT